MTSLEWQPGNLYGRHREPEYNAISYTWGRWRLDTSGDHEQQQQQQRVGEGSSSSSEIYGIVIHNVKWDIPPISPDHFTVEEFRTALRRAAGRFYPRSDGGDGEFLWLDVACIDQRRGSEDDARLKKLFWDPWFTSLWTLQESYLRQNAVLLSREAQPLNQDCLGGLRELISFCENLSSYCAKVLAVLALNALYKTVHSRGLPALYSNNPLAAYCAAGRREATDPSDYVYKIQQIFHYRLGRSEEGLDPCTAGDDHGCRRSLEAQLGARLASSWWWKLDSLRGIRADTLSADKGVAVGVFKGRMCRYTTLQGLWSKIVGPRDTDDSRNARTRASAPDTFHHIGLDVKYGGIEDVLDSDEPLIYRTQGHARDIHPGDEQQALASWLSRHYGDCLRVLLLGKIIDDVESRTFEVETFNVGLLLVQGMEDVQPILAALDTHQPWEDMEGCFV
ncbi:hypothetical protein UCREL1_5201 [Eutypa lata UCREL1]|uniref:Heterokaryon incompatibility domain-containing protein n=1 Tax=Eutypa lata (strain UCR-EL1) TaxID=1287681 RepID=M7TM41_EUTLA|nr:hypothetical protein UCREL1_5201 [Eutypa lata UCREL1]